ncbi:GNAT family N-acetyltransferase [Oryzomonas sagensis]|uniref:GNAT family N-acetyltransferase n=1 Tax=Oryzomonas sagensis TaxID=2603857 RepID=A0ABQ6TKA8_9BACT|nr:GNAT family N-acetyltransferase [Oryzomonas sagensis]KAB0668516.1 GNAT family N-acetyltransferase [Oryzomonas sagensis]
MNSNFLVEYAGIDNLNEVWAICTEIAQSMTYPSFFCCGDWLKASAKNLCPDDKLFILLAKQDGCVRAVLPLVSKPNALGGRDLRFLGTDFYPDPIGLISAQHYRAKCAKAIREYLLNVPGWDRFILDWVLGDELADWNLPAKSVSVEPFKILPRDFADLLGEFKQKKRYNLRSLVRKFLEAGGELVFSVDKGTHAFFLDALFALHQKRAVERVLDSTFEGGRVEALHRLLAQESRMVRFYGLRLHDKLIAVIYGFEFCNRFFYYQVAHDPAYGDLSPGSVLLFLALENCCSKGVTEFNFLQGDESYKGIWTNESRVLYRCDMKRGTWRSHLFSVLDQSKELCKRVRGR